MRVLKSSVFWGILLVIAGGMRLLQALGVLGMPLSWSAIFGTAGAAFIYTFFKSHDVCWWAAIPGFGLLGLAAVTTWHQLGLAFLEEVSGALFLGGVGVGFLAVYLVAGREHWWALIPRGALITLAAVAGLSSTLEGTAIAVVLFLGLALTFALLAILPTDEGRMRWPLIPAALRALPGKGVLVGFGAAGARNYVWPAALIVGALPHLSHLWRLWPETQAARVYR